MSVTYSVDHSTTSMCIEHCNACGGLGYQMNRQTGIFESCPICGGFGKIKRRW